MLDLHESAENPGPDDITEMLHDRQGKLIILKSVATSQYLILLLDNVILTTNNVCKLLIKFLAAVEEVFSSLKVSIQQCKNNPFQVEVLLQ